MIAFPARPQSASPDYQINQYFISLQEQFNTILTFKNARSNNLAQLDKFFKKMLEEHPAIYSHARTNVKGVVIQETSRGKEYPWMHKDISKFAAYKKVIKSNRPIHYAKKTENGNWFLIWSNAVFIPKLGSAATFGGVLIAKIDLKKSLDHAAGNLPQPFLVLMEDTSYYEHNWIEQEGYTEKPLRIPGAEQQALVRFQLGQGTPGPTSSGSQDAESERKSVSSGSQGIAAPTIEKDSPKPGTQSVSPLLIAVIIIAVIIFIAVGFYLGRQSKKEKDSW
jgi:hypothetical protein